MDGQGTARERRGRGQMGEVTLEGLLGKRQAKEQGAAEQTPELTFQSAVRDARAQSEELSERQLQRVQEIRQSIDLTDSAMLLQYGIGAQRKLQEFSGRILSQVRDADSAQAGELLEKLTDLISSIDAEDFRERHSLFSSPEREQRRVARRYGEVQVQIDRLATALERQRMELIRDVAMLDTLYEKNVEYYRELQVWIRAGEEELSDLREKTLPQLHSQAQARGDEMSLCAVRDYEQEVERFEKKIQDLRISKVIALQSAPQIRLIQAGDKVLVEKIGQALMQTIPLWKNQVVVAIGLERQRDALQTQREVSELTAGAMRDNARVLRKNAGEVRRLAGRTGTDVEALKQANRELVDAVNTGLVCAQEGHDRRVRAEQELLSVQEQLRQKIARQTDPGAQEDSSSEDLQPHLTFGAGK